MRRRRSGRAGLAGGWREAGRRAAGRAGRSWQPSRRRARRGRVVKLPGRPPARPVARRACRPPLPPPLRPQSPGPREPASTGLEDGRPPELPVAARQRRGGGPRHRAEPQGQAPRGQHLGPGQEGQAQQRRLRLRAPVHQAPGRQEHVPVRARPGVGGVPGGRPAPDPHHRRHGRAHGLRRLTGQRAPAGRHGAQAGRQPRQAAGLRGALPGPRRDPHAGPEGQAGTQAHDSGNRHRLVQDLRPRA